MPEVVFVESDGTEHRVEVPVGTSIMQGAVEHLVPGIEGDCGGLCACGTCHVYVPESWRDACGEADELEVGILEFAFGVDDRSRLSCQIVMSDKIDGLRLHLPKRQY
jgi:ferredoxin, 2Fe-2S